MRRPERTRRMCGWVASIPRRARQGRLANGGGATVGCWSGSAPTVGQRPRLRRPQRRWMRHAGVARRRRLGASGLLPPGPSHPHASAVGALVTRGSLHGIGAAVAALVPPPPLRLLCRNVWDEQRFRPQNWHDLGLCLAALTLRLLLLRLLPAAPVRLLRRLGVIPGLAVLPLFFSCGLSPP